ncbi:hypothetical protein IGI04_034394 [Brassica rapa subsp. trilocularis]|uniref:Uncharacterized protein n=1 Tax=Brassica rapa subsp. trilocularis TaxID=1813537 RepID=A0ABQ7L8M3_BRACM|nr:hypothetical protein IGI04_034394 [Brassica rapa subsp. trilocularis]
MMLCILLITFNCKFIKTYFRKKAQDGDHNLQNARRRVTIGLHRQTVAMEKLRERGAGVPEEELSCGREEWPRSCGCLFPGFYQLLFLIDKIQTDF